MYYYYYYGTRSGKRIFCILIKIQSNILFWLQTQCLKLATDIKKLELCGRLFLSIITLNLGSVNLLGGNLNLYLLK